jgi:predicted small secreted protein
LVSAPTAPVDRRIKGLEDSGSLGGLLSCSTHHRSPIMIKKLTAALLATLFIGVFGSLSGCNTMEGLGTDIQQGGKAIKNEAREHNN